MREKSFLLLSFDTNILSTYCFSVSHTISKVETVFERFSVSLFLNQETLQKNECTSQEKEETKQGKKSKRENPRFENMKVRKRWNRFFCPFRVTFRIDIG